ncbi:MAG: cyanophycinase [Nitrococcus sp.]|nr:cyanophycinase [Nitrococcus sp.]
MASNPAGSRGYLVAVGGAEDKTSELDVLSKVASLAPEGQREIAVIAAASGAPEEVLAVYQKAFTRLGAGRVYSLPVRTRGDAERPAHLSAVAASGVIFFTGGDQLRLTNVLGGSRLLEAIRERFMAGAVVAGTSAGAMALSTTMIYNGSAADALRKGAVNMSSGLGFVDGLIIDTHFLARGRFTRLMEVGATNPHDLGVGLGEDAAVIVHPARVLEAVGPGHVILVDSRDLVRSNVAELSAGDAVAIENMTMHALISGHGFDIDQRRYLMPEEVQARVNLASPP